MTATIEAQPTQAARLADAIIFDLDGTLANVSHIIAELGYPFQPTPYNLERFHYLSQFAPMIGWVADELLRVHASGTAILIVTARNEAYKDITVEWLAQNGLPHTELHMRSADDQRPDYEIKADILTTLNESWSVLRAYEDNPTVIQMWLDRGVPVTVVPGWPED